MSTPTSLHTFFNTYEPFLGPRPRVLVACSGGPDSVALVRALALLGSLTPVGIRIAHINHKLRGKESMADAQFVRSLAKNLGLPYCQMVCPLKKPSQGNLEEKARDARYQALTRLAKKHRCKVILTAHTLEDQAETVFMNVMRGTGADGLGGMSPLRLIPKTRIYLGRPFLPISKKEVLNFLKQRRQSFRRDRSNENLAFLRNWLRKKVFPLIERRMPGFKDRLGSLADILRGEQQFWSEVLDTAEGAVFKVFRGGRLLDLKRLLRYSPAVQRRILRRHAGGNLLTYDGVERLRHWMQQPPTGGRIWQLRKGWVVERLSKSKGSPSATLFWIGRPTNKQNRKK